MTTALLAEVTRGDWVESVHHGWAVVVDAEGRVLEAHGDPETPVFARSALKPIQAMPLVVTGAAQRLGLTQEELALACSSHSGTERQVALARSILDKAGLAPELLRCGAHAPLHDPSAEALRLRGEPFVALHNNCSGKHAAMLALCQDQGWEPATYDRLDHPLQVAIRHAIAELTDLAPESLHAGVDGCGIPAWRLPLRSLAQAFARLVADPRLQPLAQAMNAHPELVAGPDRFDTDLMTRVPGLATKAGAEAVHAGVHLESGLAWAVKIGDGNRRVIPPVVLTLLMRHGLVPDSSGEALHSLLHPPVRNRRGELVGTVQAALRLS